MPAPGKLLPYLAYPVAGLIVGWASVSMPPLEEDVSSRTRASSSRPREARETYTVLDRGELLDEARRLVESPRQGSAAKLGGHVADWSDEEILAALDEAMRDPELKLRTSSIATDLLREFAKRNPERAFEWAVAQSPAMRGRFADLALTGLLPERLDEAISIAKAHPELFDGTVPNFIVSASLTAASKRGAAAFVSRLQEILRDEPGRRLNLPTDLPADFDFASVIRSPEFAALELDSIQDSMIKAWAVQDREAAFQWVLEQQGPAAIMGLRKQTWQVSHAQAVDTIRWMVTKVEALPPEQQAEFLKAHASRLPSEDESATVWITAARTPALQDAFRTTAMRPIFSGEEIRVERGLKAVATLPDPEARLALLETSDRGSAGHPGKVQAGAEDLLRRTLAEWGAGPQRIESILKHLHGSPQP